VGGDLLLAAEREAARRGFSELTLWVLETNYPACAFYEKHGYWCDGSRKVETRGPGVSLPQVRYRK
jgi:ribosomal protein S18 acetylase RimI-like enzyme